MYIRTVFVLPMALPLHCRDFTTPLVALDLTHQLMEAVAFIHANGVVHLYLRPGNLLVFCTDDRPRLVSVDSPDTQIEGFVGTPPWVEPEIGTEDGPLQSYSLIRADPWACGQVLLYMASHSCVGIRGSCSWLETYHRMIHFGDRYSTAAQS